MPGNPIIRPHMGARIGSNIQGPSLIRVPDWVERPLGRYYLYFADHKGDHIRLAFADHLTGPWRIHEPGALQLAQSRFPVDEIAIPAGAKASPRRSDWAPVGTPGVPSPDEDAVLPHIASPDVHVDHARRQIIMYFHGLSAYREQRTRVAVSADGLNFEAREPLLGPSYFRVFAHRGAHYALAMPGFIFRSADGLANFERGPDAFGEPSQRHAAVLLRGDDLWVFWTRVGDSPEHILVSRIDLRAHWQDWRAGPAVELMRPEHDWEGANLPLERSWRSAVSVPVNQLRDPAIFEDNGQLWLLYVVQGEAGIAIAELVARADGP